MNSKQTTTSPAPNYHPHNPSQRSPPPPYKFLARNIKIRTNDLLVFKKIYLKGLCLRKLLDERSYPSGLKEIRSNKNRKLFKTLLQAQISSTAHSYALESLKASKNVHTIILNIKIQGAKMDRVALFLKQLPPRIQALCLDIDIYGHFAEKDRIAAARLIRYFRQLEYFSLSTSSPNRPKMYRVSKELKVYRKSISRLKKLKQTAYYVNATDLMSFQKIMRRNEIHHEVTRLHINLQGCELVSFDQIVVPWRPHEFNEDFYGTLDFDKMTDEEKSTFLLVQNEIKNRDTDENTVVNFDFVNDARLRMVDTNFLAKCIMHEEMKLFFRFDLFPNLKELYLRCEDHHPLNSFVIDGFAALKVLQCLDIYISARFPSEDYFFKALLKLPVLKSFSLKIDGIQNEEWVLLQEFLKGQNDLRSLTLEVQREPESKIDYLQQNNALQNIIQDLENKQFLKSLSVKVSFASLGAISQGFAHLSIANQLETLVLEGVEDPIFSKEKPGVEGFCRFLKSQKDSLKKLELNLPYILEEGILLIAEAISNLTNLRKLVFSVNVSSVISAGESFSEYSKQTLECEAPTTSKTWNLDLGKYFQRLKNLKSLTFEFDLMPVDSGIWFGNFLEILGDLKKLRKIHMFTSSGNSVKQFVPKFIPVIQEWRYIRKIHFRLRSVCKHNENLYTYSYSLDPILDNLAKEAIQKQAMRCDLMF